MGNVKRNFIFSTVLTVSNYIFPFIIYPYITRVLGVNNLGICNFVDSIINYAVIISTMGIMSIGTREIATARKSPHRLNATFTALFIITLITTIVATIALIVAIYSVDQLYANRQLLLIGMIKLWGNFFLIEWFYRGLEDFKYITIRTIIVKILFIAAMFVLVRHADDYPMYYLLLCLSMVGNAVFNCWRCASMVKFRYDLKLFLSLWKPYLIIGFYLILNSMYINFNVVYLGFVQDDAQVGLYTTSTKIFQILLALYTAYTSVVMPHASSLLSERRTDEFKRLIFKSIDGLILFSIPAALFLAIFAPGIIGLIAGPGYNGAIVPMQIEAPLLFIIGYEQIIVIQVLMPMCRDRAILFNSVIGAATGLICNILLVKAMASTGSALTWAAAEIAVLLSAQYFTSRYTSLRFPLAKLAKNIAWYLPAAAAGVALSALSPFSPIVTMLWGMLLFTIYFIVIQHSVLRSEIYMEAYGRISLMLTKSIRK